MKRFGVFILTFLPACVYAQPKATKSGVPPELLTEDSVLWKYSTVSTLGYVNTTPGSSYGSYTSGGGILSTYKFFPNNRYKYQLYVQSNSYNVRVETWTEVEGIVSFSKDEKGQNILITQATKGQYRIVKNGHTTIRPISRSELSGQHSNTFLWEKTKLEHDPKHVYLLLVDQELHPGADGNDPSTIDPGWIQKYHILAGR